MLGRLMTLQVSHVFAGGGSRFLFGREAGLHGIVGVAAFERVVAVDAPRAARHYCVLDDLPPASAADRYSALNSIGNVACVCARCCGRSPNRTTRPGFISTLITA